MLSSKTDLWRENQVTITGKKILWRENQHPLSSITNLWRENQGTITGRQTCGEKITGNKCKDNLVARKSIQKPAKHRLVATTSPKSSPQGSGLDNISFLRLVVWSPQIILNGTWLVESASLNWSPVPVLKPFQVSPPYLPDSTPI